MDASIVESIIDESSKGYVNKAARMLMAMEKQRVQLQGIPQKEAGRAYEAVWNASEKSKRWSLIINLYQRVKVEPGLLDLDDDKMDSVLRACERTADGVQAEAILREAGESPSRYNRVIRAHTKQLEVTDAVRVYRELQQQGWKLETSTINLMMQVCFAIKQVDYSLKLFSAMDALGIEADDRTFAIAIRSATQASRKEGGGWMVALRMLNAMRTKGTANGMPAVKDGPLVPSAFCFGAVIRALAQAAEAEKALSVLGQMKAAGHEPDAAVYAAVMRACAARGRLENTVKLMEEMEKEGVAPELPNVAAVLQGCDRKADSERAVMMLRALPKYNLSPTTLTYNMAMSACAKGGDVGLVKDLLAEMDQGSDDIKPDIVTLNTVLDAYKRAHAWEDLLEFLLEMENARNMPPDTVSVNTAIKACKDEGQFDIAFQLFEGMGARGLVPDSVSYTEIISACGKSQDWERAQAVFEAAKQSPLALNTFIYNAMVGAAVACGEAETALNLIKDMRSEGLNPDIVTFTTVMTMCTKLEEWEAVLFLASELEASKLSLTRPLVGQVQRARAGLQAKSQPERKEASV